MKPFRILSPAACLLAALPLRAGTDAGLERALEAFQGATDPAAITAAIDAVLALDPAFDDVLALLRRGRAYSDDVPRGVLLRSHEIGGVRHPYMILIPENYDASRRWPVRWDLHGGMGQPEWKKVDGAWSAGWAAIDRYVNDYVTVVPAGWWDSMWWTAAQVDSFRAIMAELKRTWNVDEDRIALFGGSDGAVATWFYAMRDPDPWSMYVGYVGFPARLTNTAMRCDGQMHLSNLTGQRFYLRNGAKDRIIDVEVMRKYLDVIRGFDVEIDYAEHARDGHALRLTREEELEPLELMFRTRRDPLPDRLSWATERTDRYARRSWLVIEELAEDAEADASNILPRIHGRNVPRTPGWKAQPWGRVELERDGNTVRATTVGVRRFRLLLAPDELDLDQPIRVEVDGRTAFEGLVRRDVGVLLRRAAQDLDRRVLFAAELAVEVPPAGTPR